MLPLNIAFLTVASLWLILCKERRDTQKLGVEAEIKKIFLSIGAMGQSHKLGFVVFSPFRKEEEKTTPTTTHVIKKIGNFFYLHLGWAYSDDKPSLTS